MTQYLIFRVKKDKRYKSGFRMNTFEYVSDFLEDYTQAVNMAKSIRTKGFYVGIETIETFTIYGKEKQYG